MGQQPAEPAELHFERNTVRVDDPLRDPVDDDLERLQVVTLGPRVGHSHLRIAPAGERPPGQGVDQVTRDLPAEPRRAGQLREDLQVALEVGHRAGRGIGVQRDGRVMRVE